MKAVKIRLWLIELYVLGLVDVGPTFIHRNTLHMLQEYPLVSFFMQWRTNVRWNK